MNRKEILSRSICTYKISYKQDNDFKYNRKILQDNYFINYSQDLLIYSEKKNEVEVNVIGFCIDSHNEIKRENIALSILKEIVNNKNNIEMIYNYNNRFAGKYIILLKIGNNEYLIPDATCTMQVYYSFENGFAISCLEKMVADELNLKINDKNLKIRQNSNTSQAMPNDITVYDSVYALLPNHYLDIKNKKAVRVEVNEIIENYKKYEERQIIAKSYRLIKNIVKTYNENLNIICPLTAGNDSRACYGLIRSEKKDPITYTFINENFTKTTPDYKVPLIIRENKNHNVIKNKILPNEYYKSLKNIIGENISKSDVVDNAYTFNISFGKNTCLNGDIIDQIGKANTFCGTPNFLLSSYFLQTKIHNKSKEARKEIIKWRKNLSKREKKYLADLFTMESRLGRWAAQWYTIFNLLGSDRINFFNCREVILLWMAIPQKRRKLKIIHKKIYEDTLSEKEQNIPFNANSIEGIIKKRVFLFYPLTILKYIIKD